MSDAVWEERQANTLRHDAGADHADQRERRRDSQPITKTGAAFCLLQATLPSARHGLQLLPAALGRNQKILAFGVSA
jgi:hypothetical protein